ncbi:VCBS repeat-containing protein, partial [Dongia mobilis]
NLAVRVGDITVILQGYIAAVGEADVTLLDNTGEEIDVAAVVAATDPNLDIQTAAGPAAGAPGVDNTGGVFDPFAPQAGLGGLNAVGGLNPTALQYGLIEREGILTDAEEEEEEDTSPSLVSLTPGTPVNEDDLGGGEGNDSFVAAKALEPFPYHVLDGVKDALGGQIWAYWSYPHETGNDPFDTNDHEDGSQQQPGFPDNAGGIDQDREPLTSTAIASVNFFGDVPGHLSFENAGSTPILDQLNAMGLTSHSHPLQYLILPGQPDSDPNDGIDDSRGETLVAYYVVTQGEGEQSYSYAEIVFTIAFREFEGTDSISDFNIDFTIYGVIDNVPGISDADGDITEALDIGVPFFMVDSDGSVTPAPDGALVFKDIDDVPALGSLCFDWVEYEGQDGAWLPVAKHPSDDDIGHDETPGNQGGEEVNLPSYYVQQALDAATQGGFGNLSDPIAASQTHITVSFGADGRAGTYDESGYTGNKEAGKTVFTGDGDANATAFQLYMGSSADPLSEGETNWTTNINGEPQTILARQVDAQTIVGYVLGEAEGDNPAPEIPVFILRIDPQNGEVVLVQLAQINHADTADHDDLVDSLKISPVGGAPTETVLEDSFDSLDGWTRTSSLLSQVVGDVGTVDPQPDPLNQALLVSGGGNDYQGEDSSVEDLENFFGLPAGAIAAAADDGNAGNGAEEPTNGTAIKREVNVQAGDTLTVKFNFLENESDSGEGGLTEYQDFAFIVIGSEVIRLANVGEPGTATSNSFGSFSWEEESGYLTFTFDFTVSGPIQIGFGVMNEDDTIANAGLLIDHLEISRGDGDSVTVRATDYDGDFVETPLGVTIRDDGPKVTGKLDWMVDEDGKDGGAALPGGLPGGPGDGNGGTWIGFANQSLGIDFGTDGPAADAFTFDPAKIVLKDMTGATFSPLKSGGVDVVFTWDATTSQLVGMAGGTEVMVLTVDQANGTVSFQLKAPVDHPYADDPYSQGKETAFEDEIAIDFGFTAKDSDGDTVEHAITIRIDDDSPVANDDFDSVANLQTTDGNVITGLDTSDPASGKDLSGADGAVVSGVVSLETANTATPTTDAVHGDGFVILGEHGTLTIYADGYYTYTRSDAAPLIGDDKFSYTLMDGDTDAVTANLTINIYDQGTELDTNPTGEDAQEVDEKGLPIRTINAVIEPAGTGEAADGDGTDNDDPSEATTGTMSFAAPDGFASLTISGKDGPIVIANGVTVHGLYGDLLITAFSVDGSGNGTLSYAYTLLDNVDHSGGAVTDDFAVVVEDADGDTSNGSLNINIVNDTPIANDDVDSLVGIETKATGNVLTGVDIGAGEDDNKSDGVADLPGADDGEVSKLEGETSDADGSDGFSVAGKYGTLVMDKAGNYTYTLSPDAIVPEDAEEVFTYTLTDGDDDSDTATLTITVPQTDQASGVLRISGCVAEDNQPNQWSGDQTEMPEALSIGFAPSDNETATGGSIDIPTGWQLQVWDTTGGGSEVALLAAGAGVNLDSYMANVLSGIYELRPVPPANADADGLFTLHLEIEDPDSGATSVLDQAFTVYLDAVADKPTNVTISITDDGYEQNDKGTKVTVDANDGIFVKDETGTLLVTASFNDTDGSEAHTVRVDLPAPFAFQNLPAQIPGVQSYAFDGNDLVLTLLPGTTDFSYEFDIVASGLVGKDTFDAYGTTDPFKVTATAVESPTDGGCGPNNTDADPNSPDGALDNQSTTIATLNRPNILNGEFVTNTNVQKQVALVTFVDKQDPLRAYAQLVVRGSQGQQGVILSNAGFLIDPTHDHLVGAEATAGTKVIITDFSLEGVRIVDPGNAQVEVDNNATGANEGTAIVTTINPDGDAGQYVGFEYSKDDNVAGGNAGLTDSDAGTPDYVFGAAGDDTIVATNNGVNILNGGDILDAANNGADNITGGSGTDVLVYDPLDTLDGGAGFDILRIDQGAIFNTMTAEGLDTSGTGLTNATVDLTGKAISNIESILLTEEATPGAAGTKLVLSAADVLSFTDDTEDADGLEGNTLYVLGSGGDTLELHLGGATISSQSVINDDVRGMTFTQYNLDNGGTLIVDSDVAVTTVP